MPSPSKAKGNRFEREIVNTVLSSGFKKCKRAWGSNGAALGMHEERGQTLIIMRFDDWLEERFICSMPEER